MAKKRVAFLIPGFSDGGAQRQFAYLVNYMKATESFDIHVIFFYTGINFGLLDTNGVHIHLLRCVSFYDPRNISRILHVVRRERIDLLFSWMHSCDVYSFFVSRLNKRMVWVIAERASQYPAGLIYGVRWILGRHADHIVANSEAGRHAWLKRGYPAQKTSVIQNLLTVPIAGKDVRDLTAPKLVMYAGRLEEQKNVLVICEAFIGLSRKWPDVDFVIVGEGTLGPDVDDAIQSAKVGRNIRRLPYQPDVVTLFAEAAVFVNVSIFEGLPNTVIENVASGTRVVLSHIPEHAAIVGDEYPYFVQLPILVDALEEKIESALAEEYTQDEYVFAREQLRGMEPSRIAAKYAEVFSGLLR